jgi:hypothetical protein
VIQDRDAKSYATRRRSTNRGAAAITLRRYTHTLPGELERARDLLDKFLAERMAEEASER